MGAALGDARRWRFGAVLWWVRGHERGLEFLTAYLLEYALSVDNLFVFLLVCSPSSRCRPVEVRHRVLFWGILGAFVMRATLIVLGPLLLWCSASTLLLYVFGAFLLYTAVKMAFSPQGGERLGPGNKTSP